MAEARRAEAKQWNAKLEASDKRAEAEIVKKNLLYRQEWVARKLAEKAKERADKAVEEKAAAKLSEKRAWAETARLRTLLRKQKYRCW